MPGRRAARLPLCAVRDGASAISRRSSRQGCSCITGDDGKQHGAACAHSCAQLCPDHEGAGEVKRAGQMLVQLLSRGDRWDK